MISTSIGEKSDMKGKQQFLAKALYHTNVMQLLRRMSGPRLLVINYHRICDNANSGSIFDDGVFGPTADQFKQQMIWLKKNTYILNEHELISVIHKEKELSTCCAMVTFDDGYIDNYTLAYPILRQLEIPSIYFIPTDHIISRQLGWWDIISYVIKESRKTTIMHDGLQVSLADKPAAINGFLRKMKTEPCETTKDLVAKLAEACEVAPPDRDGQSDELMTWEQIREVSRSGITIGSHTHSHTVLSTLPFEAQKNELRLSKSILEHELGKSVNSISYPVGNYEHFSRETQLLAEECGYRIGFSFNTGVNYQQKIDPFDIKRVEAQGEIEMLAAMTQLPWLFI